MKKIEKKLNYYTKIVLVLSLLFSNMLLPLRTVFAYEGEEVTTENEIVDDGNTLEETDKELELSEDENEEENKETEDEMLSEETNELEGDSTDEVINDENSADENSANENSADDTGTEIVNKDNDESSEEPVEPVEVNYTEELNKSTILNGLNSSYLFKDLNDEKVAYVVLGVNEEEIASIVNTAFNEVTYEIIEDKIILTDGDKQIAYNIVVYDEDFLNSLITAVVNDTTTQDNGDVNDDGNIDSKDVVLLKNILKVGFTTEDVVEENVTINSKFDGITDNVKVGDTFTVQYILTLSEFAVDGIGGTLNYNKSMLRLDNLEVRNFLQGENKDGKFLYFGDYLRGNSKIVTDSEGNELTVYDPADYVVVVATFTALESGNDTLSISDIAYYFENKYYDGNQSATLDVTVISVNNDLSSLSVAGNNIELTDGITEYSLTVGNDVTEVNLEYVLSDMSASISSIVAPEELAVGENTITIVVMAENGEEKTYTITVTREGSEEKAESEDTVVSPVNYSNNYSDNKTNTEDDKKDISNKDDKKEDEEKKEETDESKLSRIIIIALILCAIGGLIYLIFRNDDDDETKAANKEINKFKKEDLKEESPKKETSKKENSPKKDDSEKKAKKKER